MGTKYTEVTVSGYNTSPPSDDGSATAANQVSWAKHKDKLTDPIKTALDTMDDRIAADTDTSVVNTSSSGSIGASYHRKTVTVSGASTLTLDNAATLGDGFYVTVVNVDSSNLPVIDTTSSEAIDGGTSFTFSKQYEAVKLFCNGSQFYTVATERDVQMTGGGVLAPHKNLKIVNGTTSDDQVTVTADELLLTDGTNYLKATSVSVSDADITANAQTGPQSGYCNGYTRGSSEWAYVWVVSNGTTELVVFDEVGATPDLTGITGYTYYALVGAVYNDASTNFIKFRQVDDIVGRELSAAVTGATVTATTPQSGSLAAMVPPNAKEVSGYMSVLDTASGPSIAYISPVNDGSNFIGVQQIRNPGGNTNTAICNYNVMLDTAQTVYVWTFGAADEADFYVTGWRF